MKIQIITPAKTVYTGKIQLAQLPGTDGSFEILNNHAPIVSSLQKGIIKIINEQKEDIYFEVSNGFVESQENKITVLVEKATQQQDK